MNIPMQFWQDIFADISALQQRRPRFRDIIAALATNRGTHALVSYRIAHALWKNGVPILPSVCTRLIQILYGIDISYKAEIGPGCVIFHGVGLVVSTYVRIGTGAVLHQGVTLGNRSYSRMAYHKTDGLPCIGNNVFVGAGAKILEGVTIGDFSLIGANAVVPILVPAHQVAIGVPATLGPRSPEFSIIDTDRSVTTDK